MEKNIENHSDNDENKQVSIGKKPNNRRHHPGSRCCFGLLSLRSGIYVVSVTTFVCIYRI